MDRGSQTKNIEFEIRQCTTSDIERVMEINEVTLPENYPQFFYEQILEKYPECYLLAHEKGNPSLVIGYIMWRIERGPSSFGLEYVKKGHLVSLAVLQEYRRLGVASALLTQSMKRVMDYKVAEYVLEVRVSNNGAIKLYEQLFGYEKIKIIGHYYRDGEDAFYMSHKVDLTNSYTRGSTGMTESEIIQYYQQKHQGYICYKCPFCGRLLLKGLNYSFPGSIHPNDNSTVKCVFCGEPISIWAISQGELDTIKES